ncbi:hypothetical protein QX233_16135 [Chryseobacterium gambrini]|uniref:Uncharacterized protein n=1 Tax=Chryseobacterium gambrini TaxID=373672 RepID=A0AAJ1R5R5_9FLAO|nr:MULTISPECIES: hypothetical protein [Chryseobacterium]MDN4014002.1 hypothetical protein [Chryseobacterium gambrini]MDN4031338.1 hypothetical protein [Chryseobacterium gambrini]QWA40334.1 hypothetical protein KKI44_09090 [Chryseobacterium sp. ZHDP1]
MFFSIEENNIIYGNPEMFSDKNQFINRNTPMEAMMMMAPQSRAMEMQAFNLVDLGGVE